MCVKSVKSEIGRMKGRRRKSFKCHLRCGAVDVANEILPTLSFAWFRVVLQFCYMWWCWRSISTERWVRLWYHHNIERPQFIVYHYFPPLPFSMCGPASIFSRDWGGKSVCCVFGLEEECCERKDSLLTIKSASGVASHSLASDSVFLFLCC